MSWNFRIVRHLEGPFPFYAIHEAYYDEGSDTPNTITVRPAHPQGETIEELTEDLERFRVALQKPVLEYDDFLRAF